MRRISRTDVLFMMIVLGGAMLVWIGVRHVTAVHAIRAVGGMP